MNNELLQAAKEVLRLSDRKHDAWDALRKAIARAEASASQPAAVPSDLVARLREIWDLAERGLGYKAPFGCVKDAADEIERLQAIIASQPAPDEQREKAIESWRNDARLALPLYTHDGKHTLREHHLIPRAVALMRSAPLPAPAVPSEAEIEAWIKRIAAARFSGDSVAFDAAVFAGCALMRRASSGLVKAVRDYVDAEDEDRALEFNVMCTALRAAESTGGN